MVMHLQVCCTHCISINRQSVTDGGFLGASFLFVLGDMMFWYTNMRHHTEVVHGCSLSFSFRIHTPAPKLYLTEQRKLISDLSDEDRYRLYEETQTQDKFFLDKCHLVMKYDQVFLN